jgi:hypothetical protein
MLIVLTTNSFKDTAFNKNSFMFIALPTNYHRSNNYNYKTNSIGFKPTPPPETDDFTTEYSQEDFDDDDDISAAAIATLAG